MTRVLSTAQRPKGKRRKPCKLSTALRDVVRSVLENDPEALKTIQDHLDFNTEDTETLTRDDVVELIREQCVALMGGLSDVAQNPVAAPGRPGKRRTKQKGQGEQWWRQDTERLSKELKGTVTAQVKQE